MRRRAGVTDDPVSMQQVCQTLGNFLTKILNCLFYLLALLFDMATSPHASGSDLSQCTTVNVSI